MVSGYAAALPAYFPPAPQSCKDRASQTQWPNGPAVARATPTAAFALALAGFGMQSRRLFLALPVWFNAKTQKEARLAPSETDQPRFLRCQESTARMISTTEYME